jgi:chromosomal replication initiation ATPase DnaA
MKLMRSEIRSLRRQIARLATALERASPSAPEIRYLPEYDRAKRIVQMVANSHGVPIEAIYGRLKDRETSAARKLAIHRVREACPGWSYPALGRFFGGRDHTTIMHALGKR